MTRLNLFILFAMFMSLFLLACEQNDNSLFEIQSLEQSLETRSFIDDIDVPPDVNELCIGCGCRKAFKRCEAGQNSSCWLDHEQGAPGGLEPVCCEGQRNDCHNCEGILPICNRHVFSVQGEDHHEIITLEAIIEQYGEEALPEHLLPIITAHLSGVELTDEQYELIDDPIVLQ